MKTAKLVLVALIASSLGACCHCLKELPPTGVLPPPISLQQQLNLLNARATALPRIRAHAEDPGGIEMFLQRENGEKEHKSATGQLILQQDYAEHSAQFKLLVEVLSQSVFQIGRNDSSWWAIDYDNHQARVGPVKAAPELVSPEASKSASALNLVADFVPQLLGITEIVPESDETISMRIDDQAGTNILLLQKVHDDGTASLEREITVDRRTGDIRGVSFFTADGELLVQATLGNYAPVKYVGGTSPPPGEAVPRFPRSVKIVWPAGHGQLLLQFRDVLVPARFPPSVFRTPDWGSLGMKVEEVDGAGTDQ